MRDESAGLWEYADTVVDATDERADLVVVAHSLGGSTAPLMCARVPVNLLVLVAGMVPLPGETGNEWWANTGSGKACQLHQLPARDRDRDALRRVR